jgi:PAS domain S-box-containing protein
MENLPNLLIVDDNEENLVLLERILEKLNLNLIKALCGAEALEKTRGMDIALAIMDVFMPEMNGYELAMKMNERTKERVPIIFLTANNLNDIEIIKGYSFGAVDYMSKPFNIDVLLSKIDVFLDLYIQKQTVLRDATILGKTSDDLRCANASLKKSEERLKDVIFSMADWMWEVDENGIYTYSSDHAITLLGVSSEDIIGKTPFDFMSPDERKRVWAIFSEIMAKKLPIKDLENWNIRKDGKKICLLTNAVPILDQSGNLKGYRGVDRDITSRIELDERLRVYQIELEMQNLELKQANEKAQISAEKYIDLYDFAPIGYFTLSREGKIDQLNFSGAKLLGKDRSLLIGSSIVFSITKNSLPVFNTFFRSIYKSSDTHFCEVELKENGIRPKYMHLEGKLVFDTKQCLINMFDVSERKIAEKELFQAHKLLDLIVENIPDMIFLKEAKSLRFVRFNHAGEDLLGILKDKIIGRNDYDFFPKEQADSFVEKDRMAIQKKKMIDIPEEQIQTVNKGVRILHTKKVPIFDEKGIPEYLLGISEDISERILADKILKLSEEKYRTMLNASPDGIFLIDINGIITDVSDKQFSDFIDIQEEDTYTELINRALNDGIVQNIEIGIRKKNKTLLVSEISATFMQGVDGKSYSFMLIIRDISLRKKAMTKQIHADRMANLGEMASGMAHEINQPLNIISIVMDKILFESAKTETIDIEFFKDKSAKIFDNIVRIRNIIDHVRSFSRSEEAYVPTAFDINVSIENAVSMVSEQFNHLGIDLTLQLEKNLTKILGNTYNFEQVIINLLLNAKDAVIEKKNKQPDFEEMVVGIKTFSKYYSLIVEITDNGDGIGNEDINNVMLPFYTTKEEGKGTGLGLSICYQIIKEMGGSIDIMSDGTNGTKIILKLDSQSEN